MPAETQKIRIIMEAKLIRALYWLLRGLLAIKNDLPTDVLNEAMSSIWRLADEAEALVFETFESEPE